MSAVPFDKEKIARLKMEADEARAQLESNTQDIKERVQSLDIEQMITEHPYIALGAAAGGAFLVTKLISGSFIKKSAFMAATAGLNTILPAIIAKVVAQEEVQAE